MDDLNLQDLIHKTEGSTEFRRFLKSVGEEPTFSDWHDGHFYVFLETGLDIFVAAESHCIESIHLYSGENHLSMPYKRYKGEFANGVTFDDSAIDLIRKMGQPSTDSIENMPVSAEKFDLMIEHSRRFSVNIQELFTKARRYTYHLPDSVSWGFVFQMDGGGPLNQDGLLTRDGTSARNRAFQSASVYKPFGRRQLHPVDDPGLQATD
jgi:hypothetical protein